MRNSPDSIRAFGGGRVRTIGHRFRTLATTMSLVGLLGLVLGATTPPAAALEPVSCGHTTVVRDFLKPLKGMLPLHKPPISEQLPFGPKGLRFNAIGTGLVVGSGTIGFSIRDEAIQQTRHLNWIVTTTLSKVDRKGRVVADLGSIQRRVVSAQGNDIPPFVHEVSGAPAYYRVDISFSHLETDRQLGRYSIYARVMQRVMDLRVTAENSIVRSGEVARATLTNLGTIPIASVSYDYGFEVQAFTGERWIGVPESPQRGSVLKRKQVLPPGTKNRGCLRYLVPPDQAPGLFRFVARDTRGGLLTAEFEVAAVP